MLVGLKACEVVAAALMLTAGSLPAGMAGPGVAGSTSPAAATDCSSTLEAAACLPSGGLTDPGSTDLSGVVTTPEPRTDAATSGSTASTPPAEVPAPDTAPAPTGSSGPDSSADAGSSSGALYSSPAVTLTGDGGKSAAQVHGWGTPARVEEFDRGLEQWKLYDGPGHAGNGRRSPSAAKVQDGYLTITGDANGTTAGMAWDFGSTYGRWEGRVKAPASDPSYNALMLLWPDAENFPVGGEIDFMEMMDHTRQKTNVFLHYGADNSQISGEVNIDATQWHNWAVEWSPTTITTYVDGQKWWSTTDTATFPPGPMHMTIQLDWFPKGGTVQQSRMYVDWVRFYPVNGNGTSPAENNTSVNPVGTAGGTGTLSTLSTRSAVVPPASTVPPAPAAPTTPATPRTSTTTTSAPVTTTKPAGTTTTSPTAPPDPLADTGSTIVADPSTASSAAPPPTSRSAG